MLSKKSVKLTKTRSAFIRASFGINTGLTKNDLDQMDQSEILAGEQQVLNAIEPEPDQSMDNAIIYQRAICRPLCIAVTVLN